MAERRFRTEISALLCSAREGGLLDVRYEGGWWIATVPDEQGEAENR